MARTKTARYEVIVGNIGSVYSGGFYDSSLDAFTIYKNKSINGVGRASGESVTIMRDGDIHREYIGTRAEALADAQENSDGEEEEDEDEDEDEDA
jgi:hypothetical protein